MKTEQGPSHPEAAATRKAGSNPSAAHEPATNTEGEGHRSAIPVKRQGGGGVEIKKLSVEDAAGLERALGKAGIRSQITWLPAGMICREPHFKPSAAKTPLGGTISGVTWISGPGQATIGVMSPQQYRERSRWPGHTRAEASNWFPNISLAPESIRPDQTVVISGSRVPNEEGNPEGDFKVYYGIAEGPVKPCEPVTAPAEAPEGEGKSK
jgi:hypothetical protein